MFGILFIIIGLSALVFVHELGHLLAAKRFGMDVLEFGIGFPPRIASVMRGGTRYSLNAIPIGGFVRLKGELSDDGEGSFVRYARRKRAIVLLGGVFMNFIAGWLIFSVVAWMGSPQAIVITTVMPDSPAASAGLVAGDIISGFPDAQSFVSFVNAHKGETAEFDVRRASENIRVRAVPRANAGPHEGALGVALADSGAPSAGFFKGIAQGFLTACAVAWSVIIGLSAVFREPAAVVGPVGIISIAADAGQMGIAYALQLLGIISLNLAVLNLLPIPALDGGRLAFMGLEALRGKKFGAYAEAHANAIGFALLLFLILLVTVKDIGALFSG